MIDAVIFGGYSIVSWGTKPAGAYVVANIFRSLGLSAMVVDHVFAIPKSFQKEIIKKYITPSTKFVCLSTTLLGTPGNTWNNINECDDLFEPLMQDIKLIAPAVIFIIGGSKITKGEKSRLPFNYAIKGQGEETIKAIVAKELYNKEIIFDNDGFVSDKVYSFNDFNTSTLLSFTEHDGVSANETLPIEMARGCVFKCAFCDYNMTGKNFGDYNKNEEVLYNILIGNYEKFGTTRYQFADDTLNDSEEKINLLLKISKRLPFQLEFGAYLRVELLEKYPDSIQQLYDAGLRGANFGLETLNKTAGSSVGKGYGMKAVEILKKAKKIWKSEVAVNANIIIGLPFDTVEDIMFQQKLFTEEDFVDNVFYMALGIPRRGESLFSQGMYSKYYKDLLPVPQKIIDQFIDEPLTLNYFKNSVVWESDIMNLAEAIKLERYLTEDFSMKRPFIINNVNAFCSMSLMEHYTMQQLRTLSFKQQQENLYQIARQKVAKHIKFLLSYILSLYQFSSL